MKRPRLAAAAALAGIAAALVAGYAAAGPTGLIAVASVATLGVLIVARGAVRGEKPLPVRVNNLRRDPRRRSADSAGEFPAYRKIASEVYWAQVSWRHYEHGLRPVLARLAAALGRPEVVDHTGPSGPADMDGPGVDLARLDRIVSRLEGP